MNQVAKKHIADFLATHGLQKPPGTASIATQMLVFLYGSALEDKSWELTTEVRQEILSHIADAVLAGDYKIIKFRTLVLLAKFKQMIRTARMHNPTSVTKENIRQLRETLQSLL